MYIYIIYAYINILSACDGENEITQCIKGGLIYLPGWAYFGE